MQLKCFSKTCVGDLQKLNERFKVYSELGLTKDVTLYQCKKCGMKYIPCETCDGEGFEETIHGHFDCETCNGTGLIKIF